METPEPMWLVWRCNNSLPTVIHRTEQAAREEAERLARKHPGETFIIFESFKFCRTATAPIEWGLITQ